MIYFPNDASRCNDKNCTGQSERVFIKGLRQIYGLITRYLSDFCFFVINEGQGSGQYSRYNLFLLLDKQKIKINK